MGMLQEFRDFAVKGNVIDMAVGIIIGAAFGKVVTSLVNDIVMPPIGMLLGGMEFKDLRWTLQQASTTAEGVEVPEVAVRYGAFINTTLDFLIIAMSVFVVVKVITRMSAMRERIMKHEKEEVAAE